MATPLLTVSAVILGAGAFGGWVNFLLSKPDNIPAPRLARSVVVGIAASFLVPLFLNMISSNLIDLIRAGDNSRLLVLLGFCLVASISSTSFIKTLSDRVLAEAKQAKREAQQARAELTDVRATLSQIIARSAALDAADPVPSAGSSSGPPPATERSADGRVR